MMVRFSLALVAVCVAATACDRGGVSPAPGPAGSAAPVPEPGGEPAAEAVPASAGEPGLPAKPERADAASRGESHAGRPDVFLFVIDTLRFDSIEPCGAAPGRTPFIAGIAGQGIVFTRAFSTSSWTVPAMNSIITGLYPREHGVDRGSVDRGGVVGQQVLPDLAVTLAERLKSAGYATFGINTNQHLHSRFGFAQGFDHYTGDGFLKLPFTDLAVASVAEKARGKEPVFAWVLWFDPHYPYRANSPWFERFNTSGFESWNALALELADRVYRIKNGLADDAPIPLEDTLIIHRASKRILFRDPNQLFTIARQGGPRTERRFIDFMRAAYESEVARMDESLRLTFELFGVGEDDLVIITSDHGEEFDEHGSIGHRFLGSLYQELVHVPLIVLLPGREHAGQVVSSPVSLVDILPTILEVAGIPIDESEHSGVSLLGAISGEEEHPRAIHGELVEPLADVRFRLEWPWKYIHDFTRKSGELYRLDRDPRERRDLAAADPKRAARMLADLLSWMESTGLRWPELESVPLSNQEIERLRAMGYLR